MEVCRESHAPPKGELLSSLLGVMWGLPHNAHSRHRTGSQGEGSTLSRLRLCARLERGWATRGTAGAKRKEVQPRHLRLGETPAYYTIPCPLIHLFAMRRLTLIFLNFRVSVPIPNNKTDGNIAFTCKWLSSVTDCYHDISSSFNVGEEFDPCKESFLT